MLASFSGKESSVNTFVDFLELCPLVSAYRMNFKTEKCPHCEGTGLKFDHAAIGAYQKALRIKAGKSLREVAKKMGVSAPYVSDLERGRRNWTDEKVGQYRKALK